MLLFKPLDANLPHHLPFLATSGSAGFDLCCSHDADILPLTRQLIGTNIVCSFPVGYVGLICPRSGLALRKGLTVLNAPGVIDCDYTGEIKVLLVNLSDQTQYVAVGDRIAQLLLVEYAHSLFKDIPNTVRGDGGFGSTD